MSPPAEKPDLPNGPSSDFLQGLEDTHVLALTHVGKVKRTISDAMLL